MCNLWERKGSCSILVLTGSGSRSWAASLCCAHKKSKINLINGTNFHQRLYFIVTEVGRRVVVSLYFEYILRASYSEAAIVLLRYPIQEKMVPLAARYPAKGYFIPDLKYASKAGTPPSLHRQSSHTSVLSQSGIFLLWLSRYWPKLVETGRYWLKLTDNNHNSR